MLVSTLTGVILFLIVLLAAALIRCTKLQGQVDTKDLVINHQQKDFQKLASELKEISKFNGHIINKWEQTALDNQNLNHQNAQLLQMVNSTN